jgi:hypothetical protein
MERVRAKGVARTATVIVTATMCDKTGGSDSDSDDSNSDSVRDSDNDSDSDSDNNRVSDSNNV